MKRAHIQIALLSILLVSCAGPPARAQSGEPAFVVTTKNKDDQIHIQQEDEAAVIDIQSPTGIGAAMFELESGTLPAAVILRLHLQGLEQFRLTSVDETIAASVSSGDLSHIDQRVISSGQELPILPGHPSWMEIEAISEQPDKKYFEIILPSEFVRNAGTSFTVEWIDFYR